MLTFERGWTTGDGVRRARRVMLGVGAVLAAWLPGAGPAAAEEGCAVARSVFTARGAVATRASLPTGARTRILAIGSSSTSGVGASGPAFAYPALLDARLDALARRDAVEVENAGVPGEVADETIARLEAAVARERYDLVIWQVGTNDAVRGGDEARFREGLARGIQAARRAGAAVILLDPQYYPAIAEPARYERFVRLVGEVGARFGVSVFSRYDLMRAWADRSGAELRARLAGDGFHMSDQGYACIADLLAAGIAGAGQPAASAARAVVATAE